MIGSNCSADKKAFIRLEIVEVVLIAFVALVGSGFAQSTGNTIIEGNIGEDIFELSLPSTLSWTAMPGQTASEEIDLNVASNGYPWNVKVKSDSPDGKMREFDGANYLQNPRSLSYPLHVVYGSNDVTLSGEYCDLITGEMATGTEMPYRIILSQQTDISDVSLSSEHKYHIVVTFTGGIQY